MAAGQPGVPPPAATPRSLLLCIFWLADGLPADELQNPDDFLPHSVLDAVARLGLSNPRLVTQTVNSLAVGDEEAVEYSIAVPAILFKQPTNLSCAGHMRSMMDQTRIGLDMQINVMGPTINCQLSGSLSTPLEHYMVLGTANSVTVDPATIAASGAPGEMMMGAGGPGGMGMRGAYGRGPAPGMGLRGGGVGSEGGGAAFGAEGAAAGAPPQATATKYNTSHFAFVVQVIEAESFPPEAYNITKEEPAKAPKK
jgi:hypothetical protein